MKKILKRTHKFSMKDIFITYNTNNNKHGDDEKL